MSASNEPITVATVMTRVVPRTTGTSLLNADWTVSRPMPG